MLLEANQPKITRNRRRYNSEMNLGEVMDCIKDIMDELKRSPSKCSDGTEWIRDALWHVNLSLMMHSLEEGVLPASYSRSEKGDFKTERAGYRTLERDVKDLWTIVDELPCRRSPEHEKANSLDKCS